MPYAEMVVLGPFVHCWIEGTLVEYDVGIIFAREVKATVLKF